MLVKQLFLHDPPSFVETNPRLIGSQTGIENLFPIKQEVHSGRSLRNVNFCLNVPKLCKHEAFGAQAYFAAPWKKDLSLTTGGVLFGVFFGLTLTFPWKYKIAAAPVPQRLLTVSGSPE